MGIALTPGHVYFLESDAAQNQDWIAGGATTIDLTNFTEGTEYCKLELPQRWRKQFTTGIRVTDAGAGTSFDFRSARRGYGIVAGGIETSITNANLVEQFFMLDRHTSGASATFYDYYMVVIFSATVFVKFKDNSASTMKDYCPVRVTGGETIWSESTPQTVIFRATIRSVW